MVKIEFERFVRDSVGNKHILENRKRPGGSSIPLTYDHRVLIDGEHRATLMKSTYTRGVEIYDVKGNPIFLDQWRKQYMPREGHPIDLRRNWESTIQTALKLGVIP